MDVVFSRETPAINKYDQGIELPKDVRLIPKYRCVPQIVSNSCKFAGNFIIIITCCVRIA